MSTLIINVRSLSSRTFLFMGMFDWDEDLIDLFDLPARSSENSTGWLNIPLIQSPRGNA